MKLKPPFTYQGNKTHYAKEILSHIDPARNESFYDLCCGSGAISIELINQGFQPKSITMLDKGPWGLFWAEVGRGTFDLDRFAQYCRELPEPADVKRHLEMLAERPASLDTVCVFLLLQSGTFGGVAVWIENGRWAKQTGFRPYWTPTATSKCRYPTRTVPNDLPKKVEAICEGLRGVRGLCADIGNFRPGPGNVYIDPPYQGTGGYGHDFDVLGYARQIGRCFISEGRPLSATAWQLGERKKASAVYNGRGVAPNQEWLSLILP